MRMTLEQSQQVLFHGLAFGNTDSISLDNYKSHTTTPSNEATQLNRFTNGSRNTLKQTMDRQSTIDALLPAASFLRQQESGAASYTDGNNSQEKQIMSSTYDKRFSKGELENSLDHRSQSLAPSSSQGAFKKHHLRIHTKIDDDFQIQSSVDAEEEKALVEVLPTSGLDCANASPRASGGDNNTVVENEDMQEITGKEQSFQFASHHLLNQQRRPQDDSIQELPQKADSEEGDAFDRLIKKTYDRDCE